MSRDPLALAQNVLVPSAKSAIFMTVTVNGGSEQAARDGLADIPGLVRSVGFREPEGQLSCVTGVGAQAWERMYADVPAPADLHPFQPLQGPRHAAPATAGDLFFHLRAMRADLCFELAHQITRALAGHIEVEDEVHGFRYFDQRDLLGFVDGTENPDAPPDQVAAALLADDPIWTGGSYVIVQRYLHDLTTWDALSVEEQERVIGRTKLSDIELDDAVKPTNSHVALNTIEDADGTERQIVRDNLPFGSIGSQEFGTYFIGYAADPGVTELMLQRMFLGDPPGNYDRILDFSTAHTGCLFFVPPAGFLEDPQDYVSDPTETTSTTDQPTDQPTSSATPSDGSLGIGSLRRSTS